MSILKVYKYPHPILRQVSQPVVLTPSGQYSKETSQLIQDMADTMYAFSGAVGLAAVQVGVLQRLFVMDMTAKTTKNALRILVNPVIVQQSRNKLVREGCLSFPEYLANVKRSTKITVQYLDAEAHPQEILVEALEAVAIQHELDHLDGVLFIDRIQSLKTDLIRRQTPT